MNAPSPAFQTPLIRTLGFLGLLTPGVAPRESGRVVAKEPRAARPRPRGSRLLRLAGITHVPVATTAHPRIRERAEAAARLRRRREQRATLAVVAVVGAGLISFGVTRSPLFDVDQVALRGLDLTQQAAVEDLVAGAEGVNVFDVDTSALAAQIQSLPWTSGVVVRRHLPGTIEVRVAVSTPVIAAVVGEIRYLMDADGVVTEAVPVDGPSQTLDGNTETLPVITLMQAPTVGEQVDRPAARNAASIAAQMPEGLRDWIVAYEPAADSAIGSTAPGPSGEVNMLMEVPTENGLLTFTAHLGRATDVGEKAASLGALIEEVTLRGLTPTGLDVRIPDRPFVQT